MATNINERIIKEREKLEQLKRLKKAQDDKSKKRQAAIDKERNEFCGKYFLKHFHEFLRLQVHRTNGENEIEYAILDSFYSELAADEHVIRIKEKHITQMKMGNQ